MREMVMRKHRNSVLATLIASREGFAKMNNDGFGLLVARYPAPLSAWAVPSTLVAAGISCCSQGNVSLCSDLQQTLLLAL